ncbi:MAG TPA: hypothetical protein VHU15_11010, partial [Stellaceae bacterium]|nr:hypothetical protein [Stellaceae bacterium]
MDPRLDAEAWDRLEAELKNANAQLEKDPRGACRRALEAILFFIHQQRPQWTADRTHTSLVELWTGLNDRDNGRVPQILAPLSSANRHPDPSWRQMMQGFATSAVERLIEADPNPNVSAASEQVVEVWNKCTGEGLDSDTVRSW